ncbi:hypothetical protein [Nonomuraea sp. NPDC050202]|uniref:hypothetical protein n=1 Tax=Nonomuraea sp. NPDC050202 TaxID=3155035 RepID=UPI0033DEC89E
MPKANRRHLAVILDGSGSMNRIKDDAEGGLSAFLAAQQTHPAEMLVSLYLFDHRYEAAHAYQTLADTPDFVLLPGGKAALLDAVGTSITRMREHLEAMPEGATPLRDHRGHPHRWPTTTPPPDGAHIPRSAASSRSKPPKAGSSTTSTPPRTPSPSRGPRHQTRHHAAVQHRPHPRGAHPPRTRHSHGEDGFTDDDRDSTRH